MEGGYTPFEFDVSEIIKPGAGNLITIRNTSTTVLSRPAHYPQAGFILDYADRAGILLIPEVPAWQLTATQMADSHMRELVQNQLEEMITTQWNHPAVWAWSFGNPVPLRAVYDRMLEGDRTDNGRFVLIGTARAFASISKRGQPIPLCLVDLIDVLIAQLDLP